MRKLFKMMIMIVTLILGSQLKSKAQDQISFGDVRYDGFNNITKKAYWSKRHEAKEVYEGRTPAGVTVYEIDQDYLARFADGENNGLDRNYIIFPKGQRVYKKGNSVYAAICGNRLEYFKPLVQIKIINTPPTPACENHYLVKIYRVTDENGKLLMEDSVVIDGSISKDCKNFADTTVFTEIWKKQTGPSAPIYDEMPGEQPAKVKDVPVTNNETNNYYYTTNIYNSSPQRGGPRQAGVYRQQSRMVWIQWNGRGASRPIQQQFQPRYDPGGLSGGGTRHDPFGLNGVRPRQVFDPAGVGG